MHIAPLALACFGLGAGDPPPAPRAIDVAICLDTSGSMDGLIDAARRSIWGIVNQLATATPTPKLRLALLSYGNVGNDATAGWVRIETQLTDDLDLVSQKLFALRTNGGEEYVGRVVQACIEQLAWSSDAAALKLLVVAGNESADQDREVDFRKACGSAIQRGIVVDSIYCGNAADGDAPGWAEIARLTDGVYATIDHNRAAVAIESPFDAQITALSAELNTTYIPFGAGGAGGLSNQRAQDSNALGASPAVAAQRAVTKCNANYSCAWDLVDACRQADFELASVRTEDLPEAMRGMTLEQRRAHVAEKLEQRTRLQQQIGELDRKRAAFVAEQQKELAQSGTTSFDAAVCEAVRAQAAAKGRVATPEAPVSTTETPK
jgi:hypothetical protein